MTTKRNVKRRKSTPKAVLKAHPEEKASLEALAEAKKGKLVRVRCWTEATRSEMVTHAASTADAFKLVEDHACFYANWSLQFVSEDQAGA